MSRCDEGPYPECGSCINREHDPFECDDCDDASNYIPDEDDFDDMVRPDDGDFDVMSWSEFKKEFA
jgi:hypothetical protein